MNKLIPGSFKADLFRYCILYVYGGFYIDVKLIMCGGHKLTSLLNKSYLNYYILDDTSYTRFNSNDGGFIYQGLLISKPKNILFKKLIFKIVENCEKLNIGRNPLDVTGPCMFWHVLNNHSKELYQKKKFNLEHRGNSNIYLNGKLFMKGYNIRNYNQTYGENRYFLNYPNEIFYKNISITNFN